MSSTPLDRAMAQIDSAAAVDAAADVITEARPTTPPPPEPPAVPPLTAALRYDGGNGELLRLWLKTTALAILTLGFYRFWGRTRIRRYLWSRLSLLDDRFEYDGTGQELFIRFLLTVAVVLLPLAAVGVGLEFSGWPKVTVAALKYLEFIIVLFLTYVGHYTGQRYRLSRSLWRGIRGGLDGSALSYAWRALGYTALQSLTLSLVRPWQYVTLWRYEARHTRLGSQHLSFGGRGQDLFRSWFVAVVLGILSAVGFLIVFAVLALVVVVVATFLFKASGAARHAPALSFSFIAGGFFGYLSFIVLFWLIWTAITARFERDWLVYSVGGTVLGPLRFGLESDTRAVRRLRIGNFLLTAFTLNLAWPFVAQRTLRFYAGTLRVDSAGVERLSQTEPPSRAPASGIAELFDTTGFA